MVTKRMVAAWTLAAVLAAASAVGAQMRADLALLPAPTPIAAVARCGPVRTDYDDAWDAMLGAAALEREAAKRSLRVLEDSLAAVAEERHADAELRWILAAVTGARAEVEGGRDQIEAAKAAHARAREVLALDPNHPGAKHLIGRLHLEVLRMSRIKRFLATKVLGGGELMGATWEEARRLLEAGVVGDPCSTDHHYQLARLYSETGDAQLARERLRWVLRMPPASARDSVVVVRAAELMDALDAGSR